MKEYKSSFVLLVKPLQLCTQTHTDKQTHCFLSTLNGSWPLHLSSQTPLCDNSLHSATTVSQERHFSFLLAFSGFRDHSASPSIPSFTSLLHNPLLLCSSRPSPLLSPHLLSLPTPLSLHTKNPQNMQMCRGKKNKNGPSVNSWHLGVALLARTKWTAVTSVWSVLFMPFKVTTSSEALWRKERTNTGWHSAQSHDYIWLVSFLQILLV